MADQGGSDTIMLGVFDTGAQTASLISIPRDTAVRYNGSYMKINATYSYGGVEAVAQSVSQMLAVPIDYYVTVNTRAFREIVNEIGGVDFYVLRKPCRNPGVNWKKKISILWRPELAHIQELNGLPKYKEKSKMFVAGKILEKVPENVLQAQLCEELFERDYTSIEERIQEYKKADRRR